MLLLDINSTYTTTDYPNVWTQFTVTVSGVPTATTGRFALRYFVESGGPTGANSDYIGIDTACVPTVTATTTATTATTTAAATTTATATASAATASATTASAATATTAASAASASGPTAGPLSRAERDRPEAEYGEGTDPGTALPRRHGAQGSLPARRPCRRPEPTGRRGTPRRLQGQPAGRTQVGSNQDE